MPQFDHATIKMIRSDERTKAERGATWRQIAAAERAADIKFPPSYKQFLQSFNGGEISYLRMFGVGRNDYLDLIRQLEENRTFFPGVANKVLFPIANSWGGNTYFFDLWHPTQCGDYPIYEWDHEYAEDESTVHFVWLQIAPTFYDFVLYLYKDFR